MKIRYKKLLILPLLIILSCSQDDEDNVVEVLSIELNKSELELQRNDTFKLEVIVSPTKAVEPGYRWFSDNKDIVSVSNDGEVTALSAGKATITVTATTAQGKTAIASCNIVVTDVIDIEHGSALSRIFMPLLGIQGNHIKSSADFENAEITGAKMLRRGFIWEGIEEQPGVYDFSGYDQWVENASNKGFKILATLAFNNKIYEPDGIRAIRTEKGREAFSNFANALVEHYKSYDIIWEIWNEPNTKSFWDPDNNSNTAEFARQYVALVNTAVPKMRQADPNCTILGLSMSNVWDKSLYWMDQCGELGLFTSSGIDGITVHPYGFKWPELCSDGSKLGYKEMFDILAKHGAPDLPVYNSEIGYRLGKLEDRGVPPAESEMYQAWMFVRQVMMDWLWGIKSTVMYRWSTVDRSFTMMREDGSFRPVYFAFQNLANRLKGYEFTQKLSAQNPDDYLLLFENESNEKILVAWTTPTDGEANPALPDPHIVVVRVGGSDFLDVHDYLGNHSTSEVVDGKITIHLNGGPKFIKIK